LRILSFFSSNDTHLTFHDAQDMLCSSRSQNFALLSICITTIFIYGVGEAPLPHLDFLGNLSAMGGELSYDTSTYVAARLFAHLGTKS